MTTYEIYYRKHGSPKDYENAKLLCEEADALTTKITMHFGIMKYMEMESVQDRLIQINNTLTRKYFTGSFVTGSGYAS